MKAFAVTLSFFTTLLLAHMPAVQANTAAGPAKPPLARFYQLPLIQSPLLSPDGMRLLAIKNEGALSSVVVLDLATKESRKIMDGDNREFLVDWVMWASPERVLLCVSKMRQISADDVFREAKIISIDIKNPTDMVAMVQPQKGNRLENYFQYEITGLIADEPARVLVPIHDEERNFRPSVYKVELDTGRRTLAKRAEVDIFEWVADRAGNIRVGAGDDNKTNDNLIKVLNPQTKDWDVVWSSKPSFISDVRPLGFGGNPDELYVQAPYQGRNAVYKTDLSKPGFELKLVFQDDNVDVYANLVYSKKYRDVVGITYGQGSDIKSTYWNDELKKLQASLGKALPGAKASIVSVSDDLRKYIVFMQDQTTPGRYLYGDRDTKQLVAISDIYAEADSHFLIKRERLSFKSRDGRELSGYLSQSASDGKKPAPVILLPAWSKGLHSNGLADTLPAFLASRGYSVFQLEIARNYLTHNGDFVRMSFGRQGLAVARDIEDGVNYLLSSKLAAAGNLCVVGLENGGFITLNSITAAPDLFKCAISIGGISDLREMMDYPMSDKTRALVLELAGTPADQKLNAAPITNADKIKVPLLLIHGSRNEGVGVMQSRQMARELARLKKTYQYVEIEGADQMFNHMPHRRQMYEAIDEFLAKNLPVTN